MKHIATVTVPRRWKTALAATLCAAAFSQPGLAQVPSASVLRIDTGNVVFYNQETSDVSKYATDPNFTTLVPPRNFHRAIVIADIQAVNGQRVIGAHTRTATSISLRTAPTPGQSIADTVRNVVGDVSFEILKNDGAPIGTIMASGLAGGASPPGSPSNATVGNLTVTGGTGAFLGARGQVSWEDPPPGVAIQRFASITEDPSNRRRHGGGTQRWVVHLIPLFVPQIVTRASGPAVFHADFSPVTAANPAKAGEVLIAEVTGLGPTVPGVDPGRPFPTDSRVQVNSPVDVTVNGSPAEVINAIGWPGLVDTYRVDFRAPGGTTAGIASVQITAAWIAGPDVRIAIQ